MTSRKIPESAVENLVSDLEGKVDKTSTQTISGSKRFTQPSAGMSIELTADTNQQTVPTTAIARQIGLYRNTTYTKGDGYTSWMFGERGSDGHNSTGICVRRLLEGDNQEILNYVNVYITPDGTPITYTKTPPALCAGEEIVTAGWVRNACLIPGEIIIWSAPNPPAGYLVCNGAAISRTTYAALFSVIGTTWGVGDGNTTFNLPNLIDRAPWYSGTVPVGKYGVGALPNIIGAIGLVGNTNGVAIRTGTSGAFTVTGNTGGAYGGGGGRGPSEQGQLSFDASRSSAVYSNVDRIIPAHATCLYCIRY